MLAWVRSLFGQRASLAAGPAAVVETWPPLPADSVVIFLDIDGVMHRAENGSPERMPQLARLLEERPDAAVVISSDWRLGARIGYLQDLFPAELRHRICGATIQISDCLPHQRERECLAWARENGVHHFIAIDDDATWFSPHCRFLVATRRHDALDDEAVARCLAAMDRIRPPRRGQKGRKAAENDSIQRIPSGED